MRRSLSRAPFSASAMRSWIQSIGEPRLLADRGRDSQPVLLREDERLEVVQHHRLVDALQMLQSEGLQQQAVAPDTRRETGHRRRRAAQGPGNLAVRTAGDQAGGDGQQQLRSFHVVGAGEGLQREAASAGGAAKARNTTPRVDKSTERPFACAAISLQGTMVGTLRPRAVRWSKSVDSSAFHRPARDTHAGTGRAMVMPPRTNTDSGDSGRLRDRGDRMRTLVTGQRDRRRAVSFELP